MAAAVINGEKTSEKMTVGEILTKNGNLGLPKLFARTEINLENCLLSDEKLNNPPSLADGMHSDTERDLRFLGCELIQTASILLKLPQVAAATGQILFQRFYYSKSFVRYDFEQTAMACVYLASKIEEAPRRMRDVINVFHHMRQLYRLRESKSTNINKKMSPMLIDQRYVAIKNDVIKAERRVLKELGFCVHVKHPHKVKALIVSYLRALSAENETVLIQKAWNYMNDSLRTDIFLRYAPETIACACIFLAARILDYPLPSTDTAKWWELFDADEASIMDACKTFLKMYARKNKPSWTQLEHHWIQLKIRLQVANKGSAGVETTPNPHAVESASTEKFSPSQSRQPSPKAVESNNKSKRDERPNGTCALSPKRNSQISSQGQPKRKRNRSSSTESPRQDVSDVTNRKNYLPKRYSASSNTSRNRVDDRESRKERTRDEKQPQPFRSQSRSISPPRRKKQRKRSRSTSRLRREQEKREREVRQAIGKKSASRYR